MAVHYTGHKALHWVVLGHGSSLHWSQSPSLVCSRTWRFITLVTKACHWAVLERGSSLSCAQKRVIGLCTTGVQFAPRPQIPDAP